MASPPKRTSLTALKDWARSTPHSLPQETANQDPARHPSPRFSSDTKGTHQTAEHHSLSRPRTLSGEEADTFIPGAFPDDSKRSRSLGRTATQGWCLSFSLVVVLTSENSLKKKAIPTWRIPQARCFALAELRIRSYTTH